jgi:polyhydroxyalkanoate synthesis regulator phasin
MVKDALQTCIHLASGLSKTTRERAAAAARALIGHAGLEDVAAEAQDRVTRLADEIVNASKANTHLLTTFVTHEVDQAVERLGLARRSDLEDLRTEIAGLRAAVAHRASHDESAAAGRTAAPPDATATTRTRSPRKTAKAAAGAAKAPSAKAATAAPAKAATAKTAAAGPAKRTTTRRATKKAATPAATASGPTADPALGGAASRGSGAAGTDVGPFEPEPLPVPDQIPPAQPDEGLGGARPEDAQ